MFSNCRDARPGGRVLARSAVRGMACAFALLTAALATLPASDTEPARVLRVSADPNNLPFSNERGEGFENKIAELVARELGAKLEYIWWPQRRGFVRETLTSGRADLIIGVPAGFGRVATTRPYYASTYVFVYRRDGVPVESFDDPALRVLRVGVTMVGDDFSNTPPAHALMARGCIENIRGYSVYGDYGTESPSAEIIRAVARGEVDVAVAWGPLAGYFGTRQSVPLTIAPVAPERDGPELPFVFRIAMGVHRENQALRRELDEVITRRRAEIDRILDEYGVPRVAPDAATMETAYEAKPH